MNKEQIISNIKEIVESDLYFALYKYLYNNFGIEKDENNSAYVFNVILLLSQVIPDFNTLIEAIKRAVADRMDVKSSYDFLHFIKYKINDLIEMSDSELSNRLCHGYSVHFTSLAASNNIINTGYLSSNNAMFTKEEERLLLEAGKKQQSLATKEEKNKLHYLIPGFGFGKGISKGAITVGYWMYHTPESLSFLFGGTIYRRDRDKSFEHLENCITHLDEEEKNEVRSIATNIWNKMVGEEKDVCAVLIDRDKLEYETVTYYESPLRVEQQRPFKNNEFGGFGSIEEGRYNKDIKVDALNFIRVPSIEKLNEYCKEYNSSTIKI